VNRQNRGVDVSSYFPVRPGSGSKHISLPGINNNNEKHQYA